MEGSAVSMELKQTGNIIIPENDEAIRQTIYRKDNFLLLMVSDGCDNCTNLIEQIYKKRNPLSRYLSQYMTELHIINAQERRYEETKNNYLLKAKDIFQGRGEVQRFPIVYPHNNAGLINNEVTNTWTYKGLCDVISRSYVQDQEPINKPLTERIYSLFKNGKDKKNTR